MSTKPVNNKSTQLVNPSISSLLGVVQVMPGESEEVYRVGLLATIEELGAQTPLQIYLAEKIFECLWWMRRYETQKRAALIHEMARLLDPTPRPGGQMPAWVITAMEAMFANRVDEGLAKALERGNQSLESLRERAFSNNRNYLVTLDERPSKPRPSPAFRRPTRCSSTVSSTSSACSSITNSCAVTFAPWSSRRPSMTSPRKRLTNKANASKSTGPKTAAGMRTASLNATTHGLSVATDPDSLDPTAERVAALIASGGIDQAMARNLAAKIIDYERCMEHQRALLAQESTPPMSQEQHGQRHQSRLAQMFGKELSMIDDGLEEQEFLSGRVLKSDLNFGISMKLKMSKLVAKIQSKSDRSSQLAANKREKGAARHYKRAAN